eukprot:1324151-Rhodomonas_salina.2
MPIARIEAFASALPVHRPCQMTDEHKGTISILLSACCPRRWGRSQSGGGTERESGRLSGRKEGPRAMNCLEATMPRAYVSAIVA